MLLNLRNLVVTHCFCGGGYIIVVNAVVIPDLRKWEDVLRLSNKAVELDPVSFPDPYYFSTVAYLKLNNAKDARRTVTKVLELDKEHRFPRAELIMGNFLRFEGDIPGSTEHYRKYVSLNPPAPELPAIKAYLADLEKQPAAQPPAAQKPK